MEEEWRPVVGYEGLYEVSSRGRVKSLPREVQYANGGSRRQPGRVLKNGRSLAGYHLVVLCNKGGKLTQNVHRLVAEAFLPNPDNYPLVRHLNDIGSDNHLSNLTWGTYSENRKDAVRSGAYVNQFSGVTQCIRGHLFDEGNTYLIPSGGRGCRACRALHDKRSKTRKKENLT